MKELLRGAAERAIHYLEELDDRRVAPTPEAIDRLAELGGPLPEKPTDPEMVLGLLDDIGSRAAELSRRARGVEVWAALRSLGREGLADLVERSCRYAARFAEGLTAAGYQILNEVVLNQVLVSFGDPETTRRVIAGIQAEGTCWCGGTVWHGQTAMRTSVSSWATTAEDIERSLDAIVRVAAEQGAAR
ncbi:MAG: pyridoxal-dependent decarboxylase [Ardenticatenaceae bacterium]|nr:pyridoxal-dependent decarboxylase [Ardenticatenaceae bacterium]